MAQAEQTGEAFDQLRLLFGDQSAASGAPAEALPGDAGTLLDRLIAEGIAAGRSE